MTEEAALSRSLPAGARGGAADADEDARALLQKRLEVYARVVFWSFVTLRALEVVLYRAYPEVQPALYTWIFSTGIVGLVAMATCWRGLLVRRTLSLTTLMRFDLAYTASSGVVFGATAVLAYDRRESAYTCLVYACLLVFARVLVVPSDGRRTAWLTTVCLAPLVIAAAMLAAATEQEIPGAAYFAGAAIYCALAVTIATAHSQFIYGLRRKLRDHVQLGQYLLDREIGRDGVGVV